MANVENMPPVADSASDRVKMKTKTSSVSSSGRKKLQTLQPSGKNQSLLVGSDGVLRMSGKKEQIKIYEDPKASSTPEKKVSSALKDSEVQATVSVREGESQVEEADTAQARAEQHMYEEEHSPDYWRELAEKTREALEASLLENEELHTSLSLAEDEKSALVQERDELRDMAKQAEELAAIVNGLVENKDEEESDDEEGSESEEEDGDK